MKIAVQTEDFDVQAEVAALHGSPKVGAVCEFLRHGARPQRR